MQLGNPDRAGADEVEPCTPAVALLAKLGRWSARQCAEALKPVGLKPREVVTLVELRGGPLSQQALGEAVGVDAAQTVGLLNDLEAAELVLRRRDPNDRRRHIVEISVLGRARLELADAAMAEADKRLTAGLSPEDRAHFVMLLRFVSEHGGFDDACPDEGCETN